MSSKETTSKAVILDMKAACDRQAPRKCVYQIMKMFVFIFDEREMTYQPLYGPVVPEVHTIAAISLTPST